MTPKSKTITFECPEELYDQIIASVDDSSIHENQSQFFRYASRTAIDVDESESSTVSKRLTIRMGDELTDRMQRYVEESVELESTSQFVRAAVRAYLDSDEKDFGRAF